MVKPLRLILLLLCLPLASFAGTVTGTVQFASSGQTVNNGTFTFTPSQSFIVSGTATVVSAPVNCYTSTAGQVVGLANPLLLPVTSANYGSGTLTAATYYIKLTYWNASGETIASPEQTQLLTGTGTLIVNAPLSQPAAATGYKVYIGSATGTETLQATITGWSNYSQSAPLAAGAAPPASNTTACSLRFNDEGIPSFTSYSVNLVNSAGRQMAGYPQTWYLSGGSAGTINISNGAPLFYGTVVYPQPIMATPPGNAQQSIAGPLSLGNYGLTAGALWLSAGGSLAGTFTGNPTFSGNPIFSGTMFSTGIVWCHNSSGVRCIDPANNAGWAGSDVGAWINAAAADLGNVTDQNGLALKSGVIQMAAGDYTCGTQAVISNNRISLLGAGKRATYLTSTLNGSSCLKISDTTNFATEGASGAQKVGGFTIIGNANTNTGGLEYGDIIGLELNDLDVLNFNGTGGYGILTTAYSWFTERAQWRNVWILYSTCGWKIASGAGALNYPATTVGYGNFEAYLNIGGGQTAICAGVGELTESTMHIVVNMAGASPTAISLAANAIWNTNLYNIHVEGGTTPNGLVTVNGSWFAGAGVADFLQAGMTNTLNGRVNFSFTDENGVPRYLSYGAAGATTTCTFTSGGGTGPSCAIASGSSDLAGTIVATTGTGSPAGAGTITLTYSCSGCAGAVAPTCTYTANDAGGAAWQALAVIKDTTPGIASDVLTWTNQPPATGANTIAVPVTLAASTAYRINYRCSPK